MTRKALRWALGVFLLAVTLLLAGCKSNPAAWVDGLPPCRLDCTQTVLQRGAVAQVTGYSHKKCALVLQETWPARQQEDVTVTGYTSSQCSRIAAADRFVVRKGNIIRFKPPATPPGH